MTVLAVLGTVALALALLLTLLLALITSLFTMKAPSGPDSMGLFAVFLVPLVAWILTLSAAWMCVGRGGFDWVSRFGGVPTLLVGITVIGLGFASLCATGASFSRNLEHRTLIGFTGGLLLPLVTQGLILALLWVNPAEAKESIWPQIVGIPLLAISLGTIGVSLFLYGASQVRKSQAEAREWRAKQDEEEQERQEAIRKTEEQDKLLAAMTDEQPLAQFLVRLGDSESTPEHRKKVMERIAKLPRLREQIEEILDRPTPMDRDWALNYLRMCPTPDPALLPAVRKAMARLPGEIREAKTNSTFYAKQLMWGMLQTADAYHPVRFDDEMRAIGEAMKEWPDEDARMVSDFYIGKYLAGERIPR